MKYVLMTVVGCLALASAASAQMRVTGKFLEPQAAGSKVYLAVNLDEKGKEKKKVDSATITGQSFDFGNLTLQPGKYELLNEKNQFVALYLDYEQTFVEVDKIFMLSKVSGNTTDSLVKMLDKANTMLSFAQLGYVMMKQKLEKEGKTMPDSVETMLGKQIVESGNLSKKMGRMIGEKKNLASAIVLTRGADKQFTLDELNDIYAGMTGAVKESAPGKEFKDLLDKLNRFRPGQTAPDFTQKDTKGKDVTLSRFVKGRKLVMIDFWASWCGPCRAENPHVLALYNQYKQKGFDIIGVSLDDKKDLWLKAIAADKLPWTHVSDLAGWKNAVAGLYNVKAVPQTILVDGEGKVIATNLRGEALAQKVAEICDAL